MGVLLSLEKEKHQESINYLKIAHSQANKAGETLYELNVLINIALVHEIDENFEEALTFM